MNSLKDSSGSWMELERKRGISVSSTVLQFEYRSYCVNLLDTPGHKDFSEDTYRVLTAVDAAVMVIDAGLSHELALHTEYGAESRLEHGPWKLLRWLASGQVTETMLPSGARLATDVVGQTVVHFPEEWACNFFTERNPEIILRTLPPKEPMQASAARSRKGN